MFSKVHIFYKKLLHILEKSLYYFSVFRMFPNELFALRLQFERDVDFPPVALGDLVDVADRDVVLLEPEMDGVADDVKLLRQRLVGNG